MPAGSRRILLFEQRHMALPPIHHALALGKKSMPANVHAVSLVIHRSGDAAHISALFEHDRNEIAVRVSSS